MSFEGKATLFIRQLDEASRLTPGKVDCDGNIFFFVQSFTPKPFFTGQLVRPEDLRPLGEGTVGKLILVKIPVVGE